MKSRRGAKHLRSKSLHAAAANGQVWTKPRLRDERALELHHRHELCLLARPPLRRSLSLRLLQLWYPRLSASSRASGGSSSSRR
ncbi:hypothetical protein SKAU_G00129340 [Synaphobranchus kaupii]|uniref:Uncharacterized protein n=1 Tax=Synaphobranchus kaupii TaxID=118154 RepID=A0A9Q1FR30_SYNKA|nr:hypothetical protein SKAU_G00129340 [Synaphobranchus kaupii]